MCYDCCNDHTNRQQESQLFRQTDRHMQTDTHIYRCNRRTETGNDLDIDRNWQTKKATRRDICMQRQTNKQTQLDRKRQDRRTGRHTQNDG